MLSVFEYQNYRVYLADYYKDAKQSNPRFSYRAFARRAGLASPAHLRLVMSGQRNLTHKTIPLFLRGLGLRTREARYFETLVYFSQAQVSDEKIRHFHSLERIRQAKAAKPLSERQDHVLFEEWYMPLIYELVRTKDFSEEPAWIAKKLGGQVPEGRIRRAIENLIESGLLVRSADHGGRLRPADPSVQGQDDVVNLLMRQFHGRMLREAGRHLDDPLDKREFGFVTVASTRENFLKVKRLIKQFVREVNQLTSVSENAEEVYQLNIQLFCPLSVAGRRTSGDDGDFSQRPLRYS